LQHSDAQAGTTCNSVIKSSATEGQQGGHRQRLAFLLPNLGGGGVQRNTLITACALHSRGYPVELVLHSEEGPLLQKIPDSITRTILKKTGNWPARWQALRGNPSLLPALSLPILAAGKPSKTLRYLPALIDYLRDSEPDVLFSAMTHMNIEAVLARNTAKARTQVTVIQSNNFPDWHQASREWRRRHLLPLLRHCYHDANAIISVSRAVGDNLSDYAGINRDQISTIYAPIVPENIGALAAEPVGHPWLQADTPPVILAVGRPGRAKDYPTLLHAFALVHKARKVHLIILGAGQESTNKHERLGELQTLAQELGIQEYIDMPGYTHNPYRYMARASLLALSSLYEGGPNVVPEAMACGCPVVSTRCPGGVSEFLQNGRYGRMVAVGDHQALADAICTSLDEAPPREMLMKRGLSFSVQRSTDAYESLVSSLTDTD